MSSSIFAPYGLVLILKMNAQRAIYCSVANFIASSTGFDSDFSYVLAASGNSALLCVMGSHLLIHFKEAAEEGIGRRMCALSTMELGLDSDSSKSTGEHCDYMVL